MKVNINKDTIVRVWLGVAITVGLIITLPIIILVLPFIVGNELAKEILGNKNKQTEQKKKTSLFEPDMFNTWTSFFNIPKQEGW